MRSWRESTRQARLVFTAAMAVALLTAALHLMARGGRLLLLHQFQPIGPDDVWMTPLAEAGFFAVIATPFMLLALLRPGGVVLRWAVFVFSLLGAFFVGLQTRSMHPAAALVLALGIAWRLTASWRAAPDRATRWTNRLVLTLVGTFLIATGVNVARTRDHGPLATVTPGPTTPNVLILLLDTVGARHLSLHGYERATSPNLDVLARDATVFDNAIAPASWTLPSHASLFTGVIAAHLSARWSVPLDRKHATLAERFSALGYRTAGFTANLAYTVPATGLARGFQYFRADGRTAKDIFRRASIVQTPFFWRMRSGTVQDRLRALWPPDFAIPWEPPKRPKRAAVVVGEFLRWQEGVAGRPFFAFLNLFDAHDPYEPPAPFKIRFAGAPSAEDQHDGAIAYMDEQIGVLLDTLRRRGVLDRTILVITSDHGKAFGEHGLRSHGNSLYRELIHVPLVMRYPKAVPAGVRIPDVVSLTDLPATLLGLAGGGGAMLPGQSLATMWQEDPVARVALSWVDPWSRVNSPTSGVELASATDRDHVLIVGQDGRIELFDHRTDPEESQNLADAPEMASIRLKLQEALKPITNHWTMRDP